MNYKRPETLEELTADLESHPERGKINGKDVVRFGVKEISGVIPHALADLAFESGAPFGFTRDEILCAALTMWVTNPEIAATRVAFQRELSEKHETPVPKVRSKIRGAYKRVRRVRQLNVLENQNTHDLA